MKLRSACALLCYYFLLNFYNYIGKDIEKFKILWYNTKSAKNRK